MNLAYDHFAEILNNSIRKSTKTILINSKEKKIKPWITKGLVFAIRKRDKMKEDLRKNKTNLTILNKYREYRNLTNNLIKKVKRDYYHNKILENKNNIKKIWETVNESLNEKKSNNIVIKKYRHTKLDVNGSFYIKHSK